MAKGKAKKKRRRRAAAAVRRVGRRVAKRLRRRGRTFGLAGKTGIFVAVGAPVVLSGAEAASEAVGDMRANQLDLLGTATDGMWRFVNNISQGFGFGNVRDTLPARKADGTAVSIPIASKIPSGSWYKTLGAGSILVAFDVAVSWGARKLAGIKAAPRILGQKLIGGK